MIEHAEYLYRQDTLSKHLGERGFDGCLVISRGGGTFDRYANVFYLTGFYQSYAYLPNEPPRWSGRSHTAFLMRNDGECILCVSVPEYKKSQLGVKDVRHSEDFTGTISSAIKALKLEKGNLCLIGADTMPVDMWQTLQSYQSAVKWIFSDDILDRMRRIKSPAEQDIVRDATKLGREAYDAYLAAIRPGITEAEAVAAAAEIVYSEGGGITYAACSSGPDTRYWSTQQLPGFSKRKLENGDMIRLDLIITLEGYLSDFGRTVVVGNPTTQQSQLIQTLHQGLDSAIAAAAPGAPASNIALAGNEMLRSLDVQVGTEKDPTKITFSYPAHWGHGLGLAFERPWLVETEEIILEPGMVLAVECALSLMDVGTAAAEQNLIVTEHGYELLTAGSNGVWS